MVMLIGCIGAFIAFMLCHYWVEAVYLKVYLYFLMGLFSSVLVLSFTVIRTVVEPHILSVSMGVILTLQKVLLFLPIPIIGFLFKVTDGNYVLATTPVIIMAFGAIVSAILLMINLSAPSNQSTHQ